MKTQEVVSAGGVGDLLLVYSKTYRLYKEKNIKFKWAHFERHRIQIPALFQLAEEFYRKTPEMFSVPPNIIQCQNPEQSIQDILAKNIFFERITTKAEDEHYPLSHIIPMLGQIPPTDSPYICIQHFAGRIADGTARTIDKKVIEQIHQIAPGYTIMLIGHKSPDFSPPLFVVDNRGTKNIIDALSYINGASLTIGQDGALTYYSVMRNIFTIINFHDNRLLDHYLCEQWLDVGKLICVADSGNILDSLDAEILQVIKYILLGEI